MATEDGPGQFGVLLQRHRLAAGLSQEELAEQAGLSRRGISDLERGARRAPYPGTVRRLAEALGLAEPARAALLGAARTPSSRAVANKVGGVDALHNLPVQLTSFIGRIQETAEIRRQLANSRLLTLTGPGGVGKTRLALHVAEQSLDTFVDGVWFVDLSTVTDGAHIAQAVARTLGLREIPSEAPIAILRNALRHRPLLLLPDDCAHLIDDAGALVTALLSAAPAVRVLATSREPLGVAGEQLFRVNPLHAPDPDRLSPVNHASGQAAAVELFIDRARLVAPPSSVEPHALKLVAYICHQLDGLPLAIELAAARLRALSVEHLAARLDQNLRLLVSGNRSGPRRQRTLTATLEWSYQLLGPAEQALFERLAVFIGGWTLEAAEAIGTGDARSDEPVVDLLTSLVDKSLVVHDVVSGQGRYHFLETIRRYAVDRCAQATQFDDARSAHAAFYLDWLASDPRQSEFVPVSWVRRLDLEYDNIRAAVRWMLQRGSHLRVVGAGAALTRYGAFRGYLRELREWWQNVLEAEQNADAALASRAGVLLALVMFLQGEDERASSLLTDALAV